MQQEGDEKAGRGDLVPEVNRARFIRLGLRLAFGLMGIMGLTRAGKEQPQQPTE